MKQNIFIAALLAGMLALAGCGGGSSSNNNGGNNDKMPPPPPPPAASTPTTLALPGTATIDGGGQDGAAGDYDIKAGGNVLIGSVYFECAEGGADCVVTVGSGRNLNSVTYTGGTVRATATNPAATARTTQPTVDDADAMQISKVAIQAAIEDRGTIHGFGLAGGGTAGTINGLHTFPHENNEQTLLFLRAISGADLTPLASVDAGNKDERYVYWGYWTKGKIGANTLGVTPAGTTSSIQPNLIWGGNTPYGKKPDSANTGTATAATYSGTGNVDLYHRASASADWAFTTGSATLNADFVNGTINGSIAPTTAALFGTGVSIELRRTSITGDTFSGSTRFTYTDADTTDTTAVNLDRGSGNWNGQFFGAPLARDGTSPTPSHVAGQFSVTRGAKAREIKAGITLTPTGALTVHGVFADENDS